MILFILLLFTSPTVHTYEKVDCIIEKCVVDEDSKSICSIALVIKDNNCIDIIPDAKAKLIGDNWIIVHREENIVRHFESPTLNIRCL